VELKPGKIMGDNPEEDKPKLELVSFEKPFRKMTFSKGQLKMLRDGKVEEIVDNTEFQPGDMVHTGDDGSMEITTEDTTIKIGKNTNLEFIGLEFDPVPNRRIIPPPKAPWALDYEVRHKINDETFLKDVWADLVEFNKENPPKHIPSCLAGSINCLYETAGYIDKGVAWFDKKIKGESKSSMVITPESIIFPDGTEFSVEVADDGTTTVTTFDGRVLVMDLESRNIVAIGVNEQVTTRLEVTKIDPDLIDNWWEEIEEKDNDLKIFLIILLISTIVVGIIGFALKKTAKPKSKTWGVTSLVFGICSVFFGICSVLWILPPYWAYFGLPLAIGAIWFSRKQKKIISSGMATAGRVMGIIGVFLNVIIAITFMTM